MFESPIDGCVTGSKGKPLFLKRYKHPNAQYTLVLVHGTAGWSARRPAISPSNFSINVILRWLGPSTPRATGVFLAP